MIIEKIITPWNPIWGTLFTSEPFEHQFYQPPDDNEKAKWKWVTVKDRLRTLIEFEMVRRSGNTPLSSEPNMSFRDLVENFRPLFIHEHLHLPVYAHRMIQSKPFLHARVDPKDARNLLCDLVTAAAAEAMDPGQIFVPAGWSRNIGILIKEYRMHHIDDRAPPGHRESNEPEPVGAARSYPSGERPPDLWAHSLSDTSHLKLRLTGGTKPHWTWGDVFTTPLGAN